MPGLFKIGHTIRDPRTRCDELYRSSACPTPFELLAHAEVSDAAPMERHLHAALSPFRHNSQREFFRCRSANWLALAFLRNPAARGVGADPGVLYDLGTSGWFHFNPWDECDLNPMPRIVHPDLRSLPRQMPDGLAWPLLDKAEFNFPRGDE